MPDELPSETLPVLNPDALPVEPPVMPTEPITPSTQAVTAESAPTPIEEVHVDSDPSSMPQPLGNALTSDPADDQADAPVPIPESLAADAVPEPNPEPEPPKPSNKHWYVIKVQSGREDTIKDAVERKVRIEGLEEFYGQILIPVERIQELRRGKRVTKSIKLYPGYLFAELEFNDRMLYLFRETSGVGDFVGGGATGKPPTPMRQSEVDAMLNRQPGEKKPGEEDTREPEREVVRARPRFSVGDRLRVIDGNFATMEGEVIDITEDKVKLQVLVLGMPVTLDLDFWQVEAV